MQMETVFQRRLPGRLAIEIPIQGFKLFERLPGGVKLSAAGKLQLQPLASLEQMEAIRSGRLDAGFVFNLPKADPELDGLPVAMPPLLASFVANVRRLPDVRTVNKG